jgi:hypothetical protein
LGTSLVVFVNLCKTSLDKFNTCKQASVQIFLEASRIESHLSSQIATIYTTFIEVVHKVGTKSAQFDRQYGLYIRRISYNNGAGCMHMYMRLGGWVEARKDNDVSGGAHPHFA